MDAELKYSPLSVHRLNASPSAIIGGDSTITEQTGTQISEDEANAADLACAMITYPSTHGVFEQRIVEA